MHVHFCLCVCACSSRDETRLSAALSDCTHERSQNNNKEPSVGRMKALSPTISAQRDSSPTVSLTDTSHITWRQEKGRQSLIFDRNKYFCMLMRLLLLLLFYCWGQIGSDWELNTAVVHYSTGWCSHIPRFGKS